MSKKRFIRNIVGDIYDSEKDKWFEEDWQGKPIDYDDDLIVFLNEQQLIISKLDEHNTGYMVENLTLNKENNQLKEENKRLKKKLESLQKVLHLVECVIDE